MDMAALACARAAEGKRARDGGRAAPNKKKTPQTLDSCVFDLAFLRSISSITKHQPARASLV